MAAVSPCSRGVPSQCVWRRHVLWCPSLPQDHSPDAWMGAWSSAAQSKTQRWEYEVTSQKKIYCRWELYHWICCALNNKLQRVCFSGNVSSEQKMRKTASHFCVCKMEKLWANREQLAGLTYGFSVWVYFSPKCKKILPLFSANSVHIHWCVL